MLVAAALYIGIYFISKLAVDTQWSASYVGDYLVSPYYKS